MNFSKEICAIANINEKCCSSCYHYCQDGPTCNKYPSISNLCEVSDDIRTLCPQSCGICGKCRKRNAFISILRIELTCHINSI